jgi:hypothetical protein
VFPVDTDNDMVEKIEEVMKYLDDNKKIILYEVKQRKLCQIVSWWKYQTGLWAMSSKYPAPDGWVDRIRYQTIDDDGKRSIYTENWNMKGGFSQSKPKIVKNRSSHKNNCQAENPLPDKTWRNEMTDSVSITQDKDNVKEKDMSKKGDLVDGLIYYSMKATPDSMVSWCPENLRDIMKAVIANIREPSKKEQKEWIRVANELYENNVNADDIANAVRYMRDNNLVYHSIHSIVKVAINESIKRLKSTNDIKWEY